MLELVKYNESFKEDVYKLRIKKEQETFVSSIDTILDHYHSADNVELLVFLHYGRVIGLVLYRVNDEFKNVFIWQMILDKDSQGKSFGSSLLLKTEKFILNNEKYNRVITTVKDDNIVSCMLFLTHGFEEFSNEEDEVNLGKTL